MRVIFYTIRGLMLGAILENYLWNFNISLGVSGLSQQNELYKKLDSTRLGLGPFSEHHTIKNAKRCNI
jgi:hypothetical protein